MSNQEQYLKEIANELKLIRKQLEKTNDNKTVKVGMDVSPEDLTTIVNEVNASKDAKFKL
ncbi:MULTISPECIES: hypothetical protein [Staphylococcus]|uniref:hypothetical protein n=1 Tax=Staphylococcus TaxID=1279 RepID=UPI00069E58CB|nr:hypothetical protein [Staphylococcus haemolyticus]MCH4404962.1 hypothetical protein [Staphylococcus haemolyticus]MDT3948453.1 hypothetical protein [Staphylococcus haemolyticus]TJX92376.1 hypothetical protein FAF39_01775 [Staphylococcus haemolyticus]